MSQKIVVLSGSPRKGGNTDKLAAAFIEGARYDAKEVTLFRVADMAIGGCMGCGYCRDNSGICVQKDDMQTILEALRTAEAIVFASPVYYFAVTAQLKLAIDRTYALLREKTPLSKAALLMTCGNQSSSVAEGAITMYHKIRAHQKLENAGIIVAAGLHGIDAIEGRDELGLAGKLGREI